MPKRKLFLFFVLAGAILTVLACRNPTSPQPSKPAPTGTAVEISLVIADQGETLEIAGTQENLTIYKAPAKPGSADSLRLRVNTSAYTYAWYVDGVFKTGGPDITINAADYAPGGHTVLLKAEDSKHVPWSKKIFFNVRLIDQEG